MKILEVIPSLASGGAERFTVDLCNKLAETHDVTLLLYYDINEYGFYADEVSPKVKLITLYKKKGIDFTIFFKLGHILDRVRPDIVHMHLVAINYMFPYTFSRRIKFYMTIHNDAEHEAGSGFGKLIRKICFKKSIVPVTISEESLRSFESLYKMTAPMIINGRKFEEDVQVSSDVISEIESYKPTAKSKVIVNLARITSVKRQTLLARVAERLYKEGYDFTLLLIGAFQDQMMVDEISSLNCPIVHLLGERVNPIEYLKSADAFCLSSSFEGMPISLIEAMSVGLVPLCTPVGGIKNMINDGENGFLAIDLSEKALYDLLKRFFASSDEQIKTMGGQAKKTMAPFDINICADKYLKLFSEK